MARESVKQTGIQAAGDVVAGDKVTNITYAPRASASRIAGLLKKLQEQTSTNCTIKHRIAAIQHYEGSVDSGPIIGLEAKLQAGHRSDDTIQAIRAKELFAKRQTSQWVYEAAQEIYAHVLGVLHMRFIEHALPAIEQGLSRAEVDKIIVRDVIGATLQDLGENNIGIEVPELQGMLYFLTGNCFLAWNVKK